MAGARSSVILDEPTSVLAPQEVDALFAGIATLRAQGLSVVIITHKLREARAHRRPGDRAARRQAGRCGGAAPDTLDRRRADRGDGRPLGGGAAAERPVAPPERRRAGARAARRRASTATAAQPALRGRRPRRRARRARRRRRRRRQRPARARTRSRSACAPIVDGHDVGRRPRRCAGRDPRRALALGAVGVPEDPVDRRRSCPGCRSLEHLALGDLKSVRQGLGIDWERARDARRGARRGAPGCGMAARNRALATLSGGNIQRVMLARALGAPRSLVVAAYPSRGLDIATTRRTQELLLEQRAAGAGVLLISRGPRRAARALRPHRRAARRPHRRRSSTPARADRYEIGRLMLGSRRHDRDRPSRPTVTDAAVDADGAPTRRAPTLDVGGAGDRPLRHRVAAALVIFGVVMLLKGVEPDRRATATWCTSTLDSAARSATILVRGDAAHPRRARRRRARPGPGWSTSAARASSSSAASARPAVVASGSTATLPGGVVLVLMMRRRRGRRRRCGPGSPALLRAALGINEAITTLLLNYVALDLMLFLIYDPWKDPRRLGPADHASRCPGAERLPLHRRQHGAHRHRHRRRRRRRRVAACCARRRGASARGSSAATPRRPAAPGCRVGAAAVGDARRRRARRARRHGPARRRRVQAAPGLHSPATATSASSPAGSPGTTRCRSSLGRVAARRHRHRRRQPPDRLAACPPPPSTS